MRVRADLRRRGIGRQLLAAINGALGGDECWCLPYAWLTGLYGTSGFKPVEVGEAPKFLTERHTAYRDAGLDVVIMRRHPRDVTLTPSSRLLRIR